MPRVGGQVRRRELLKAAAATLATGLAPRLALADRNKTLVFVPTSDLTILDPIVTFNRPTRNYAYPVFDTLYGIDTNWRAQPQMVEGHDIDKDGLVWTLKLREGLRFHDKEPVLARDVVAGIRRFATRISFAAALMGSTDELSAPDDRTVRFRLKRSFPHLPEALAGPGGTVPAIMPERLAADRRTSRSVKSLAADLTGFWRKNMSAAPAPPSSALRRTSRGAAAPWASPPDRKSRISIGSSG